MAKPGAKPKLTKEMTERLCGALRAGNTRRAACEYAGISQDSFANYLRQSADFSEAVRVAESHAEVGFVAVIAKAARDGNWKAAAWWLERHPNSKGDWRQISELDLRKLTVEQLLALEAACEAGVESPGDRLALAEHNE